MTFYNATNAETAAEACANWQGEHQVARMTIGVRVVTRLVYFLASVSILYLIRALSALLLVHYKTSLRYP